MAKLLPIEENGQTVGYSFDCPGCRAKHDVHIRPHKNSIGASWDFNGNPEKPTFSPSIRNRVSFNRESGKPDYVCHLFVTNGEIRFLSDCTHSLAGLAFPIPEVEYA